MIERFHRILEKSHVGCEEPRAYFIPFSDKDDTFSPREKSTRFFNLCGQWDFRFFDNVEELEIEDEMFPLTVECEDKIDVPMCWQLYTDRGYDVPNYINQDYPFPVDPPYLPDKIPGGLYRRKFNIDKHDGSKYYINFEGVSSCFYIWINGKFVGYSQVSHCTSEFDVSSVLFDGENTVQVLVVKHCDGSYLEDQDFFRLSGIFREVYILERDCAHIKDIYINVNVSDNFDSAEVCADAKLTGDINLAWRLVSPSGIEIGKGESLGNFKMTIENPILWNTENPELYKLEIIAGSEKIGFLLAINRTEIKNSSLLMNGQKIKIRGINRHDSNPETGYAVSVDDMMRDLLILKRANVNAIRTSHYPNDPRFLDMCARLGFMVIDEADLETHGMGYNFGDWYWDYWAFLLDSPDWREICVDRAKRLFERDKNCGCVIMWSLGNESGCGENHRHMANYIRSRNSCAIIHYENARLDYQERRGIDYSDISDVESRMYAPIDYLKDYLSDSSKTKPFFYCEYVDSNSTGDIHFHWDDFENCDKYCGGCIWEFCDHAVKIGTKENPKYRYGGDFGDWPNDNVCCLDGLVYPDRTLRPGYYDMKYTYQPLSAEYNDGKIEVFNKRFFKNSDDLGIEWTIEENGEVTCFGKISETDILPRSKKTFEIFDGNVSDKLTTLNIYYVQLNNTEWADCGYKVGFSQFILSDGVVAPKRSSFSPSLEESNTRIKVSYENTEYTFNKITGCIVSIKSKGEELLSEPVGFSMWHGCTYNSKYLLDIWKRARYDKIKQKTYSCKVVNISENEVAVECDVSFASAAMPPAVRGKVIYTFVSGGGVNIAFSGKVTENAPELPKFGINIIMPKKYENIEYIGYGPHESYVDRYKSARISKFKTTVTQSMEHYIKPQECSSHYKVKTAKVTDENGKGLVFADTSKRGFCFKALHFDDAQILNTMHDDELVPQDRTIISVDYKIHAMNQGLAYIDTERAFDEKEFSFSYDIVPE